MSTAVSIDSRTHDGTEPAAEHLPGSVGAAIESGVLPDRVWVYSNYHCNLECAYCLTESAPRSKRRMIGPEHMVAIAEQAAALGFRAVGVTGESRSCVATWSRSSRPWRSTFP